MVIPENPFAHYTPRPLEIVDTTLREGQQTSLLHDYGKYFFPPEDKQEILQALILYGVKFVELFAPVVSPREAEDFEVLKAARDALIPQRGYTFLLAHVRAHPADVEAAIQAGFDGLNMYMGTSPQSRTYNHGKALDEIARRARSLLEDLRRNHPHLILRFSGEDAFRTPLDDLYRVYDEVAPLVDRLGMPDTVGVATPSQVSERVGALHARYPRTALETHFHNDRGFALLNALRAVQAGAQYVNTTVLGIGERSGITSLTALLFNLFVDGCYDHLEGYHLRASYPLNVLLADKLKTLVPFQEPVSLTNRTHTAGVHQGAVLRHASVYEAHPLELFGVSERDTLLGPLSGWNMIHYFLREIHYFDLDEATARRITRRFKAVVYEQTAEHSPAEVLLRLAEEEFNLRRRVETPPSQAPAIIQHWQVDAHPHTPSITVP
ncbi:MAG: pyruvate carboxyltransferase [Anaerolineae bacterium]|nr:MAG: pyruvate carboxyltransferase [Anaerolineae bacterium]